ncbi:MAG: hypothetical protein IPQ09_02735 [Myxococcales bacterium]|nr:hypothetical protein [Myxococcales bacterium]
MAVRNAYGAVRSSYARSGHSPPLALMLALMLASREARAARPIELTVSVNDDLPGSGYSEITPENRASRYVDSCRST